jgi:preprotein translocase subunit SecG
MKKMFQKKRVMAMVLIGMLFFTITPNLGMVNDNSNIVSADPFDLIIGDAPPNEKLLLENTTYLHYGDVFIFNQGEIEVKNAEFRVYGNIWIFSDGKITVDNGTFGFLSVTKWQFSINLFNVSELRVQNSQIYSNLYANLINPNDNSSISFDNVTFTDWFSCKMADNSSVDLRDSYGPKGWASEFFFMDYATGNFSNVSGIINVFTVFHNGAIIDYSPLWNEYVFHYEFPADVPFAVGVNYNITIDDCWIYGNSPLLEKDSDVTVRNCITSVIIRPINDDYLNISGLVANTYHSDWNAPLSDRQFRAVNSIIRNWHLHIFDYAQVNLVNSIFSEILAIYWNTSLYMRNTIYKGDAGPFWVFGESTVYAQECVFFAQDPWGLNPVTYVRDYGTLALYNSYVYTDFTIEGYGTVYLLNSETFREPLILEASELWVAKINSPATGLSNDSVPIYGSAYIDTGPYSNVSLGSYQLSYASGPSYDVYTPIGPERTQEVRDGVLEYWNTSMMTPAIYYLKMDMKDNNLTDNVSVYWVINIQRSDVLHNIPTEPLSPSAIENAGNIELNWNPPSDNGNASVTNYTIYRGFSMGSLAPIDEVGNVTNYVDDNVTPGTTYFYKISATNKMGEGPLSQLVIISMNPIVDLILTTTDISFSNSTPMEGQMITIYGDIQAQNLGSTETVWVELIIDGTPVDVKPVTITASPTQIQFNWTAVEGLHDITMDVDIVNTVTEASEANNIATKQITVSASVKPDLVIDSSMIEFSDDSPMEDENVTINITINAFNLSENLNVVVDFLIDNKKLYYSPVQISSENTILSFIWGAEAGSHDIKVVVDAIDAILESNEANNEATKTIDVQGKPIIDFSIAISDIEFSQSNAIEGDLIWINATIHTDNLTGSPSVLGQFSIDDEAIDYQNVVISSTDTIVSFSWTAEEGDHTFELSLDPMNSIVEANELNNIASKGLTVMQKSEPDLSISSVSIVQTTFNEGDLIDIEGVINANNLPGNQQVDVEFYIDDVLQSAKSIMISNGTNNIRFNWTAQKGGHNLKIKIDPQNSLLESSESNNIDSLDVHVNTQTIDPEEKEGEDTGFSVMTLILGVVFLIIGLIIGMLLAKKGKGKATEYKEELGDEEKGEKEQKEIEEDNEDPEVEEEQPEEVVEEGKEV